MMKVMFEQQVSTPVLDLWLKRIEDTIEHFIHWRIICLPRNGLSVLSNRNTRSMLKILVVASDSTDAVCVTEPRCIVSRSMIDIITNDPSMTFHPECKYVWGPQMSPLAMTFAIISAVKMTVKMRFVMFKKYRSWKHIDEIEMVLHFERTYETCRRYRWSFHSESDAIQCDEEEYHVIEWFFND